ncbi:hypothetical protein HYDPIDRAFT_119577 [Hydnomerulius pinastri MD-312]|uniref:DUF6593 domain-containing protein n=1 Tax=Hydnomerulius pinastri MD-312 TaxID=994086 RepID=A0A0C9VLA9_9AGAM|nr:hypothetical protein HYDPIDRAFT_119577 [Hydnomerulius pinastri MD-312]
MRLTFSHSHCKNTEIFDEQDRQLYTVSTPSEWHEKTTITKHPRHGDRTSEVLAEIEWHFFHEDLIKFGGQDLEADTLLEQRNWSTGRYFTGPDGRSYKWKHDPRHCWLKEDVEGSDVELAKFHPRNAGWNKPEHPPYLEVSDSLEHMLDLIIITFIYVEKLRHDEHHDR